MTKVKVLTDSCSDIRQDLLEEYGIDYLRMETVSDGVSSHALLTWSAQEAHGFFDRIRSGEHITTAQVPASEFMEVFKKYLDQEYDIVYIGCSSKQSGSVNTGAVVAKKLLSDYPDRKISCIDSLNASIGIGMLAFEAAKMAKDGASADDITERILSIRNNVNEYVTVHTLDYLKKAGRVKGSAAFFGNLFGVKPIIVSDADGEQTPIKKVKGRKNSLGEIVNLLKESIKDPENQTVYVAHCDCPQQEIDEICEMIKANIPCKDICVWYIGPIIGASIGPDAIGVFAFGNEVTFRVGETK